MGMIPLLQKRHKQNSIQDSKNNSNIEYFRQRTAERNTERAFNEVLGNWNKHQSTNEFSSTFFRLNNFTPFSTRSREVSTTKPVKGANADTPGNVKKIKHDFEETNLAFTHLTIWSTRLKGKSFAYHWGSWYFALICAIDLLIIAFEGSADQVLWCWLACFTGYALIIFFKGPTREMEHFFCVLLDNRCRERGIEVSTNGVTYYPPHEYIKTHSDNGRPRTPSQLCGECDPWRGRTFTPMFRSKIDGDRTEVPAFAILDAIRPYMELSYQPIGPFSRNCQTFGYDLLKCFGDEHYYVIEQPQQESHILRYVIQTHRKKCKRISCISTVEVFTFYRLFVHVTILGVWALVCTFALKLPLFSSCDEMWTLQCPSQTYVLIAYVLWFLIAFFSRLIASHIFEFRSVGELCVGEQAIANHIGLFREATEVAHLYYNDEEMAPLVAIEEINKGSGYHCWGYEISRFSYYSTVFCVMAMWIVLVFSLPLISLILVENQTIAMGWICGILGLMILCCGCCCCCGWHDRQIRREYKANHKNESNWHRQYRLSRSNVLEQSRFTTNYWNVEDGSISMEEIKSQKRKLSTLRGSSLEEQIVAMLGHRARYSSSPQEKALFDTPTDRTLDSIAEGHIYDDSPSFLTGLAEQIDKKKQQEWIAMQKRAYEQATTNKNTNTFE